MNPNQKKLGIDDQMGRLYMGEATNLEKVHLARGLLARDKEGPISWGTLDPWICLLYTSPSPRDATLSRMPSSA